MTDIEVELLEIKEKLKLNFAQSQVGKTLDFLFEENKDGFAVGYAENYLRLYVKDIKGKEKVKVKVISPYKDGAIAILDKGEN